ncbi:MAG: 2Fe-2S iron-sulfur cluster binding domain-containing protein [SAR324 cluster bacterium]|nr:2Fe-2S iron-sulfur cluster binding domain-containing protein [SAR324 cluster bacterium]
MTEQQSVKPKEKEELSPKTYRITFLPEGKTIEVGLPDPDAHHEGEPGSILDWADRNDINIDHACGGFAACSTCHVIVRKGLDSCSEIEEDEEDMLDEAPGLTLQSRLSCQCVPDGSEDLVVEIPAWNRNLASEGPH